MIAAGLGVPHAWSLILSTVLFALGLLGVVLRRGAIPTLIGIEIMFAASLLTLLAAARERLLDPRAQVFVLVVCVMIVAQIVVGAAIVRAAARRTGDRP